MKPEDLAKVLEAHRKWLFGEPGGIRADLIGANLRGANLRGADLSGSRGVHRFASVSFTGHGVCGRQLLGVKLKPRSAVVLYCGCFCGSEADLRLYIAEDLERFRLSRTLALDTVLALLAVDPVTP